MVGKGGATRMGGGPMSGPTIELMARVEPDGAGPVELVRLIPSDGGQVIIERRIHGEAHYRTSPDLATVIDILCGWVEEVDV